MIGIAGMLVAAVVIAGCGGDDPAVTAAKPLTQWQSATAESQRVAESCYWLASDIVDVDAWRPSNDEIRAAFVRAESEGGSDTHYLLLSANVVEPDDFVYSAVVSEDKNISFGAYSWLAGVRGSSVDNFDVGMGAGRSDDRLVSACVRALVPKGTPPGEYRLAAGGMSAPIRVVPEGESGGVSMANRGRAHPEG